MDDVIGKLLEENNVPDTPTARAVYRKMLEPKEWVGLTDEDIHNTVGYNETREMYQFALALIAKLKEKNT